MKQQITYNYIDLSPNTKPIFNRYSTKQNQYYNQPINLCNKPLAKNDGPIFYLKNKNIDIVPLKKEIEKEKIVPIKRIIKSVDEPRLPYNYEDLSYNM